jgi:hypothetical protein
MASCGPGYHEKKDKVKRASIFLKPSYTTTRLLRDILHSTRLSVPADSSSSSPCVVLALSYKVMRKGDIPPPLPLFLVLATDFLEQGFQAFNHLDHN